MVPGVKDSVGMTSVFIKQTYLLKCVHKQFAYPRWSKCEMTSYSSYSGQKKTLCEWESCIIVNYVTSDQ